MPAATTYTPPVTAILHQTEAYFGPGAARLPQPVHLVQYDQTVPILAVALYGPDGPYKVPAGAEVNVRLGKPDGKAVYNPALGLDAGRSTVYVAITPQMTVLPGDYAPILEILVDQGVAGTSALSLKIHRNPVQQGAIESSDEYQTVQQLLELARKAQQAAAGSAQEAEASAGAAADSEGSAASSAAVARDSAAGAASSKAAAAASQTAAAASAANAAASASAAGDSKNAAAASATNAAKSAGEAAASAEKAEFIAGGAAPSALKLATPRQINGTAFDGTEDINTAYGFNGVLRYPASDHITGQAWQEFATAPLSGGGGASDYNHASYIFTCVDANPKPLCVVLAEFGCAEKNPYVRSTVLSPGARVPQFGWVVEDSTVHFYLHTLNNYRSEVFVTVLGKSLRSTATPTLSTQLAVGTEPAGIVYSTDTRTLQDAAGTVAGAGKLATPRQINGTAFDGTQDIRTATSYNIIAGGTGTSIGYGRIVRIGKGSTQNYDMATTLLVSGFSNFGNPNPGLWLVTASTRVGKFSLQVTEIKRSSATRPVFGWWEDDANFYVGVQMPAYAMNGTVTRLLDYKNNSQSNYTVGFAALGTDPPEGWTEVSPRVLQDTAAARVFAVTLTAAGWVKGTGEAYTQTAACPGLLAAYDLEAPQVQAIGVQSTDAARKEGLDTLCEAGNFGETLDGALKWTCYGSHPAVDLPLRLRRSAAE